VTHLRMTLVGLVVALAGYFLPDMALWPDIIIRSLLVAVLFTAGVYLWKLSDDMNRLIDTSIKGIKKWLQ